MKMLIAVFALGALCILGCKNQNKDNDNNMDHSQPQMMSTQDDCPNCPGVQHADASGKCPMCGAKVK